MSFLTPWADEAQSELSPRSVNRIVEKLLACREKLLASRALKPSGKAFQKFLGAGVQEEAVAALTRCWGWEKQTGAKRQRGVSGVGGWGDHRLRHLVEFTGA